MTRRLVLFVGVGGQGVLTAAEILGAALHDADVPVVVGQLHGMSQRGGSVEAQVLLGPGTSSLCAGMVADVLIAFEPLEALRALPRVAARTRVLLADGGIVPYALVRAQQPYPTLDEIRATLGRSGAEVHVVAGPALASSAGAGRTLNVVMLGALAGLGALPLGAEALWDAVAHRCPPRFHDANRRAFALGQEAVTGRPAAPGLSTEDAHA